MGQYISRLTPEEPMLAANQVAAPISSHLINKDSTGLPSSDDINIKNLGKLYNKLSRSPSNVKSIKSLYSMSNRPSIVIPPNEILKPALISPKDDSIAQTNVKPDGEAVESHNEQKQSNEENLAPDQVDVTINNNENNLELNQVIIEDNKSQNKFSAYSEHDLPSQHDVTSENQQFKVLTLQASDINDEPLVSNQQLDETENKQNDFSDAIESHIPSEPTISQHMFTQRVVSQRSIDDGSQLILSDECSLSQQFLPDTSDSQQDFSDVFASPRVIDDRSGSNEKLDIVGTESLDSSKLEDMTVANVAEVISVSQQVSMDLSEQNVSDNWKSVNAKAPVFPTQNDKVTDRLKDVVFNIPELSEFRVSPIVNDSEMQVWLKDMLIENALQKSNY